MNSFIIKKRILFNILLQNFYRKFPTEMSGYKHFDILVAHDDKLGISKQGKIPWNNRDDKNHVKMLVAGATIIMGRKTYQDIPNIKKVFSKSHIFVITNTISINHPNDEEHYDIKSFTTLDEALKSSSGEVYIFGGSAIYEEIFEKYMYLCRRLIITHIPGDFECDNFFPNYDKVSKILIKETKFSENEAKCFRYLISETHQEYSYLNALRLVREKGELKTDRTTNGTLSVSGVHMKFDISKRIPLLTTKKILWKKVLIELLWFISGSSDVTVLQKQGVFFWNANTNREFLDKNNMQHMKENTLGRGYGYQWRRWGENEVKEANRTRILPTPKGFDQLAHVIHLLKYEPHSRRIIMTAWNPSDMNDVALPPCHILVQWTVSDAGDLDCILTQRSGDMFLGVPFNIASYSMLTYMLASIVGLKPRYFIHNIGEAHIYRDHISAVDEQLRRFPYPPAKFIVNKNVKNIDSFTLQDFDVIEYLYHDFIKAEMIV